MNLTVNPSLAGVLAQAEPATLLLTPGTVIDAQVLKQLADNAVRIAIAGLALDVMSETPLQVGQALKLAVSQSDDGVVRLAVVDPPLAKGAPDRAPGQSTQPDAGSRPVVTPLPQAGRGAGNPAIAQTLVADVNPVAAERLPGVVRAPPIAPQTIETSEARAVSLVVQSAATKQTGLAPLFANLVAAVATNRLPPDVQAAAVRLLRLRPALDADLSGERVKTAVAQSGLFLEASLATKPTATISAISGNAPPDLKVALLILRQVLSSLAPDSPAAVAPIKAEIAPPIVIAPAEASEPLSRSSAGQGLAAQDGAGRDPAIVVTRAAAAFEATKDFAVRSPVNVIAEVTDGSGETPTMRVLPVAPRVNEQSVPRTDALPPPFKGAPPSAQPLASPSIAPDMPVEAVTLHLLADTDGALARQTLLQVASLPDRVDAAIPRVDPGSARWALEIPFVTPQGTAVAQFEITRDGGGQGAERVAQVWRARFSLDIEPAGPVHALVSFSGAKTSVLMWAERPATAAQLRAGTPELSKAFANARLEAGEISVRDGAPPAPPLAKAGHFLDRAS